jgi:hypothetical protein
VILFNDFLRGILRVQGKRKPLVHIPLWVCFPAARVLSFLLKNPPVTVDNLVGLRQMTAPDITAAERDFGFTPRSFAEGLEEMFGQADNARGLLEPWLAPSGAAAALPIGSGSKHELCHRRAR